MHVAFIIMSLAKGEGSLKTLLLNKEQVRNLISMKDVIESVEHAFMAFSGGKTIQPPYAGIHLPAPGGEVDFKTGYYQPANMISMKASSGGFTENVTAYGLPSNMGSVLLFDGNTGGLLCIMDGSLLTGLRTGASGAVSVKCLARKASRSVSCIGTGNQARMQVQAISEVMSVDIIHAWSRDPQKCREFCAEMALLTGISVVPATSKQAAVEQADILVTTTRGKGDIIEAGWVKPGTHIVAIGTDARGKQEFDPTIFSRAKVITDSTQQCIEKGETAHGIENGFISKEDIHGEIGDILSGRIAGRSNDTEITLFDSTGMAIQDNTTATRIYNNAIAQGTGEYFSFF